MTGRHQATTFALGELDPNFGAHPARAHHHRPRREPSRAEDRNRSVADITTIQVAVSTAGTVATPPGSIQVRTAQRAVIVSAERTRPPAGERR